MIKIGEDLKFSPPVSNQESKLVFENIKSFCIQSVDSYFEAIKRREEFIKRCMDLSVSPIKIKKFSRSNLPIDVRCRGENILAEMEELDEKRREEKEREKRYMEGIARGEIIPVEGKVLLQETLNRFSKGKEYVEASQMVENPSFYKQWINEDSRAAGKLSASKKLKQNSAFESLFGITKDLPDQDPHPGQDQKDPEGQKPPPPIKFQYSSYAIPGKERVVRRKEPVESLQDKEPLANDKETSPLRHDQKSFESLLDEQQLEGVDLFSDLDRLEINDIQRPVKRIPGHFRETSKSFPSSSQKVSQESDKGQLVSVSKVDASPPIKEQILVENGTAYLPPPLPPPPPLLPQFPTITEKPELGEKNALGPGFDGLPSSPVKTEEFRPNEGGSSLNVSGPVEQPDESDSFKKLSYMQDEQALSGDFLSEKQSFLFEDKTEERGRQRKELLVQGPKRYFGHHGMDLYPEWYQGRNGQRIFRNEKDAKMSLDMNLSSRVKDSNKLVPLSKVYVLPEIFTEKGGAKPKVGGMAPSGYDRHGLINIPSKKRLEEELAYRLDIGEIYKDLNEDVVIAPLDVKYPVNDKVYYVNAGGIRKFMPNYNLNPVYRSKIKKNADQHQKDLNNQEVLRDFLKIIEEKKRKRRVRGHARTQLKDELCRQRVSNAYKIHMTPKKQINMARTREFAPMSSLPETTAVVRREGRIRFSDIIGKEDSEGEKGAESGNEMNERIYVPGKVEVDDLVEDQDLSENHIHKDDNLSVGERQVRFLLPVSENRPKKKYVSPPPMQNHNELDEDDEDGDEGNDDN